jgi:hypothetical protein
MRSSLMCINNKTRVIHKLGMIGKYPLTKLSNYHILQ